MRELCWATLTADWLPQRPPNFRPWRGDCSTRGTIEGRAFAKQVYSRLYNQKGIHAREYQQCVSLICRARGLSDSRRLHDLTGEQTRGRGGGGGADCHGIGWTDDPRPWRMRALCPLWRNGRGGDRRDPVAGRRDRGRAGSDPAARCDASRSGAQCARLRLLGPGSQGKRAACMEARGPDRCTAAGRHRLHAQPCQPRRDGRGSGPCRRHAGAEAQARRWRCRGYRPRHRGSAQCARRAPDRRCQ